MAPLLLLLNRGVFSVTIPERTGGVFRFSTLLHNVSLGVDISNLPDEKYGYQSPPAQLTPFRLVLIIDGVWPCESQIKIHRIKVQIQTVRPQLILINL